ncbi:sulfonate ABC transporter substrate-binding protein [Lentzea pudingi]|uniref:Sulfonate ABC transporter substrate-binding protein n=1 Tax=Lentzea pudingi TaxID=1789439 RepID=A0ABQ2I0S6_9PSEU|nr:ABC transporter substrate-binding protein [Lentzea pudingi]GGM97138.1 sulfonate ABC transporter substrate-binding protein [Lentzea pudingi]
MATRATALRLVAVLTTCVLTASCGLFGGSSNGGNADVERNVIRIGVLPVVDVAPLRIALTEKLFEKAGLQVNLVTQPTEAEAIKQLDTTLDLTWATHVSLFRAVAEGTELQLQGEAYQAGPNSMALVAKADSDYDDPGKKNAPRIAVNSETDIGALTTRAVLDTAAVEKQKIKFTSMAFADMENALTSGTVDAAFMIEPFITKAQRKIGAKIVTDTARGPTLDFPMSGYASSKKFAEANPKTLKVFRDVLRQAQQRAQANKLAVQDSLTSYADVDAPTAALVSVGTFPLSLNPIRLQRVADMMDTEDVLSGRLDVQQLLPPGTTN